jgi:hypothetical protein
LIVNPDEVDPSSKSCVLGHRSRQCSQKYSRPWTMDRLLGVLNSNLFRRLCLEPKICLAAARPILAELLKAWRAQWRTRETRLRFRLPEDFGQDATVRVGPC